MKAPTQGRFLVFHLLFVKSCCIHLIVLQMQQQQAEGQSKVPSPNFKPKSPNSSLVHYEADPPPPAALPKQVTKPQEAAHSFPPLLPRGGWGCA